MSIQQFPRCAAYLKACNYNLRDETMGSANWAVCISEAFTDDELVKAGTISFETMTGPELMSEFERLMSVRHSRPKPGASDSLKAFIGSRGVKVSALKSDEDFWIVARILWPQAVTANDGGPLSLLHHKIKSLTKRQRQEARANLSRVPAKWRASQPDRIAQ